MNFSVDIRYLTNLSEQGYLERDLSTFVKLKDSRSNETVQYLQRRFDGELAEPIGFDL